MGEKSFCFKVLQKDLLTGFFCDDSNSRTVITSINSIDTGSDEDNSSDNSYDIPINSDNVLSDFDSCGNSYLITV